MSSTAVLPVGIAADDNGEPVSFEGGEADIFTDDIMQFLDASDLAAEVPAELTSDVPVSLADLSTDIDFDAGDLHQLISLEPSSLPPSSAEITTALSSSLTSGSDERSFRCSSPPTQARDQLQDSSAPATPERRIRQEPQTKRRRVGDKSSAKPCSSPASKSAAPSTTAPAAAATAQREKQSRSQSKSKPKTTSGAAAPAHQRRRTLGIEGFMAQGPTIDEAIAQGLIPPLPEGDSKQARRKRRLMRNRISAQLHRERKKLYLETLENRVESQMDEIDMLNARLAQLSSENEGLKAEVARLKRVSGNKAAIGPASASAASSGSHFGATTDGGATTTRDMRSDTDSGSSVPCSPLSPPASPIDSELWLEQGPAAKDKRAPTAGKSSSNNNSRKRSIYMMGVFFMCALFGGSLLFADDAHRLSSSGVTQADSSDAVRDLLAQSPTSGARPSSSRRRHLLAVEDAGAAWLQERGNATAALPLPTHLQKEASSNSKAVALWTDVMQLHQPPFAARKDDIGQASAPLPSTRNDSIQLHGNGLDELLLAVTQWDQRSQRQHQAAEPGARDTPVQQHKFRGAKSAAKGMAVVPYAGGPNDLYQRALSSLQQLQLYVHHRMQISREAGGAVSAAARNMSNSSLLLCARPYGRVAAPQTFVDPIAAEDAHKRSLVLLLPSSSVHRSDDTTDVNGTEVPEWDGTWVEVDATITSIRSVPLAGPGGSDGHGARILA